MAPRKTVSKTPNLSDLDNAVITHGAQDTETEDAMTLEPSESVRQLGGAEITGQQLHAGGPSYSPDPEADARDAAQIASRDAAEQAAQESTTSE